MALVPQPPIPPLSPSRDNEAPGPFWLGVAGIVLAVAAPIAALCREIAARWRGIVIAHLFFLTLWLAIQVFFFATGAYWCVPSNGSKFVRWLMTSVPRISRCGQAPVGSLPLLPIVAAPVPPLEPASPPAAVVPAVIPPAVAPPAVVPASPPPVPAEPVPVPVVPPPAPAAPEPQVPREPLAAPPPAVSPPAGNGTAAVPATAETPWSAAAIPNCWRDRTVKGGDCYRADAATPHRSEPSRARSRHPAYARRRPLTPEQCRRHPWECWPNRYGPDSGSF